MINREPHPVDRDLKNDASAFGGSSDGLHHLPALPSRDGDGSPQA